MKASELMINDLVQTFQGKYGKVSSINIYPYTSNSIDVNGETYDEDRIEPIPLTKEILDKNGIYENDDINADGVCYRKMASYYVDTNEPCRCYCINNAPHYMYCSNEIQYIHELQHALRLCDLNKLADNFVL